MIVNVNIHHPVARRVDTITSGKPGDFYVTLGDSDSVALFFTIAEWEKFVADVNEKRGQL